MGPRWLLLFLIVAPGFSLESSLLTPSERTQRVRMKEIIELRSEVESVRLPDFVFHFNADSPLYSLTGMDKQGRPWSLEFPDPLRGGWLSEEGKSRTYYFIGYTGGNGFAPFSWILTLSFDERGLPVPFYFVTHGAQDRDGIEDALNLDGGEPELLQQDYWGNFFEDPGHYVTTLYRKRGAYWHRSEGRYGSHTFPTYERWSVMWRGQRPAELVPPVSSQDHRLRDVTNDPALGVRTNDYPLGSDLGCRFVRPDILVKDSPRGRTIQMAEGVQIRSEPVGDVVLTGLLHDTGGRPGCWSSIAWMSVR